MIFTIQIGDTKYTVEKDSATEDYKDFLDKFVALSYAIGYTDATVQKYIDTEK